MEKKWSSDWQSGFDCQCLFPGLFPIRSWSDLRSLFSQVTTMLVGIIISKIILFEGLMNSKGTLVKFLLRNIAIKLFILKVFYFRFFPLIFSDNTYIKLFYFIRVSRVFSSYVQLGKKDLQRKNIHLRMIIFKLTN